MRAQEHRRLSRRAVLRLGSRLSLVAAFGGAMAGCEAGGETAPGVIPGGSPTPDFAGSPTAVHMTDQRRFDPPSVRIRKGAQITWINSSNIAHTATDDPSIALKPEDAILPGGAQPWDSGLLQPGDRWTRQFTVPGDYTYFCVPHESNGMIAHITVTP